jgi:hypothetical protein
MGTDSVPKAEVDSCVAETMKDGTVVTMGEFDRLAMAIGAGAWGEIRGFTGSGQGIAPLERIKEEGFHLPKKMRVTTFSSMTVLSSLLYCGLNNDPFR